MPALVISLTLTGLYAQEPISRIETFDGAIVFSQEQIILARTWELTGDLSVKAVTPAGETLIVPAKGALLLETGAATLPGFRPRVVLRNGESIIAQPQAGGNGRRWSFTSPLWKSLQLDDSRIARYQAAPVSLAGDPPARPSCCCAMVM